MAEGIRLVHDTLRGVPYVVEHPTKRYEQPRVCIWCNKVHTHKAIHLRLGADGTVIVSSGVFKVLRQCGMPGLTPLNTVAKPPRQNLNMKLIPKEQANNEQYRYEGRHRRLHVAKNRLFTPRKVPNG